MVLFYEVVLPDIYIEAWYHVSATRDNCFFFFKKKKLGFPPCKAGQPLQGMELQEKETQKD